MKVCVKSQKLAEEYGRAIHEESSVLISIAAKADPSADVQTTDENKIREILFLKFDDTSDVNAPGRITAEDAEKIKDFVLKYKDSDIDTLIVNCGAGQSRSAGVAAAILLYLTGSDKQIFGDPRYTPNNLCYHTVLDALMSNGQSYDDFWASVPVESEEQ